MKNLSFFGRSVILYLVLGTLTPYPTSAHNVPIHATPNVRHMIPPANPRNTIEESLINLEINHLANLGRSLAPRTMAAGPLHYEIPENKTVSEQNRAYRNSPVDCFSEGARRREGRVRFISESNNSRSATRACERSEANSSARVFFGSFFDQEKKNIIKSSTRACERSEAKGPAHVFFGSFFDQEKKNIIIPTAILSNTIIGANTLVKINHPANSGRSSAPRTLAAGHLHNEIPENKTVFERERVRFISESNDSRSAKGPALDLFVSFWEARALKNSPVDYFSDGASWREGRAKKKIELQQTISGKISDSNGPLPAVTISVKDGTAVTISDQNGRYEIAASPTDTLVFTLLGYKPLFLPINNRTTLNAILVPDATQLQEVTINAGYYKVKDKERTGSIAKITADDIATQPVTNVLAAMQGRMAGVNITQDSGTPGGGFKIQVRGQNSLRAGGNDPLYVIDGVPYASETIGSHRTATAMPATTSPLNSIDPASIESIEVLKDADATAIYGSRGANGVVLITTKKGRAGKTIVSVNAYTGVGKVARFLDMMDTEQYLAMRHRAFANDGITEYPETAYDINGTWDQTRYTNWQKELLGGSAEIQSMQGTISGGSATTQFSLSGNYRNETTVYPGDFRYKKGSAHLSLDHLSLDKKFRVAATAGYTAQDNLQSAVDLAMVARSLAPDAPALYDENGDLNWENGTFENPVANLGMKFTAKTSDLVANTVLSYEFAKGFEARSSFGYSDLKHEERRVIPSTIYNPAYEVGSEYSQLYVADNNRKTWIVEPQLNYTGKSGAHKWEVLVGGTLQNQATNKLVITGLGFSSNALINNLASASQLFVYGNEEIRYKYQALFARANYNYGGRYILNLTGRRDGSSRFGPGNRFGTFGAVGAAWVFSKEKFLSDSKVLSFGKLRTSYGTSGNDQIGDYQYLNTYASMTGNYQGTIGLQPTRLFNADFGWEVNRKFEAAIEAGFLHDQIFLTAAWYQNRSSSQLVGIPLPGTTGFPSLNANLDATVQNSGVEVTLHTLNFKSKNFSWSTDFNIAAARNKLIEYEGLESSSFANTYVVGQSIHIQKLFHYTGVDSATGVYMFEDVNGDGVISAPDDNQTIADLAPEFFGGLRNELSYKNWSLDFLFQFIKQQNYEYPYGFAGEAYNQPASVSNSWSGPGSTSQYQILTSGLNDAAVQAYGNYTASDASVVDASYVRLKNIALSYDLPKSVLPWGGVRIYVQAQNALTFTRYKGDPEFNYNGYLPPLRVFSGGVQMTF